jgi:molybdenum cofactor biosynthesis protein B
MTDGDHGRDHSHVSGDGEHATEHAPDSERGHDHVDAHPDSDDGDDGEVAGEAGTDEAADDDGDGHHHDAADQDHTTDGHHDHAADEHHAADVSTYGAAVLTVSSSRDLDSDASGDAIVDALEADGGSVVTRELVADDFDRVQGAVANLTRRGDVDVVVSTGGTGVSPDDVTPDAIEPLLAKRVPGFGEEFRRRSIDEVGAVGMLSRALAGVSNETLVVALPGSEAAATTGVDLLTSVLGHALGLVSDDDADDENAGDGEDVGDENAGDDEDAGDADDEAESADDEAESVGDADEHDADDTVGG